MDNTPPCRVCKSTSVLCYDPENPSSAICPDCCATADHSDGETGHTFEYSRGDRDHACTKCGVFRRSTDYDYTQDEDYYDRGQ